MQTKDIVIGKRYKHSGLTDTNVYLGISAPHPADGKPEKFLVLVECLEGDEDMIGKVCASPENCTPNFWNDFYTC